MEKNLKIEWIDYWKVYDMVPHSWVIESLYMMSIAKNVIYFWKNDEVLEGGATVCNCPTLYSKSERALDSLIQTLRIFGEDTGMQFGIDKCAILVTKKGKIVKSDGVEIPKEKRVKSLEEGVSFRCARSR